MNRLPRKHENQIKKTAEYTGDTENNNSVNSVPSVINAVSYLL